MNETKPLLNNNGNVYSGSKKDVRRSTKSWLGSGALGIALIGVGVLIGSALNQSSSETTNTSPPPPPPPHAPPATSRNRRFCRIYGDRLKFAGVLQTSIGDPSQQWSHLPCYEQPKKNDMLWWASQDSNLDSADINGYGAPDAVFRTNFGRQAFPDRQPIVGFGAAFTEASSLNYQSLSDAAKERLMELLFGKTGIGYSIGASRRVVSCCAVPCRLIVREFIV